MNKRITVPGFYEAPGLMTEIGIAASQLGDLPSDVSELCQLVQGWFVHVFWAKAHSYVPEPRQADDTRIRGVEEMFSRLAERNALPLSERREFTDRLLVDCRAYSVMLAALLIHSGIPARARCGFAGYFWPPSEHRWEDHWITEYWSRTEGRWLQADAQLDEVQQRSLRTDFDPSNLPSGRFLPAPQVWSACREGSMDPEAFRWDPFGGLTLIRWNLIRDVAALNQVEALGWDHWGGMFPLTDAPLSEESLNFYDEVARLCADDTQLQTLHAHYRDDLRLRAPRTVWLMRETEGNYITEPADLLAGDDEKLIAL